MPRAPFSTEYVDKPELQQREKTPSVVVHVPEHTTGSWAVCVVRFDVSSPEVLHHSADPAHPLSNTRISLSLVDHTVHPVSRARHRLQEVLCIGLFRQKGNKNIASFCLSRIPPPPHKCCCVCVPLCAMTQNKLYFVTFRIVFRFHCSLSHGREMLTKKSGYEKIPNDPMTPHRMPTETSILVCFFIPVLMSKTRPNPHWASRHKCKQMVPAIANGSVHTESTSKELPANLRAGVHAVHVDWA